MLLIYYQTPTFTEVAEALLEALKYHKIDCRIVNQIVPDDPMIYIIFGLNNPMPCIPKYYIAYQMEQAGSEWFTASYIERLAGALVIWDYSLINIKFLKSLQALRHIPVKYVPLGYSSTTETSDENLENSERNIDLLFFGTMNQRRIDIIDQIRTRHPNWIVEIHNSVWGPERLRLIQRSKIVLNLHYYPQAVLETCRISYLLSVGALVVSEPSSDPILDRSYTKFLVFADDIEKQCNLLLTQKQLDQLRTQYCTKYRTESPYYKNIPIEGLRTLIKVNALQAPSKDSVDDSVEVLQIPFNPAETQINEGSCTLKLNEPVYQPVTLITPTRNRYKFMALALRNFRSFKYPPELLEWIIIDDSDPEEYQNLLNVIPADPRIHLKHVAARDIWHKRNLAIEASTHNIIIHLDDDDYYFPESVHAKVQLLEKYRPQGYHCVGSREIGIYDLINNKSCLMKSQMMGEAGLAYDKSFWQSKPYADRDLKFGEGAYFLQNRCDQVIDFPYWFNLIAISHRSNYTGNLRRTTEDSNIPKMTNLFSLWDLQTQLFFIGLRKKIEKN